MRRVLRFQPRYNPVFFCLLFSGCVSPVWAAPALFRVDVLACGFGDAIALTTPGGHRLLVDGCGREGRQVLRQSLFRSERLPLDMWIVTHPHPNHGKGLLSLLDSPPFPFRSVVTNGDPRGDKDIHVWLKRLEAEGIPVKEARRGDRLWREPGLTVEVLHPYSRDRSVNDNALVLSIEYYQTHLLLTSDVGPAVQAALTTWFEREGSQVIQVPHHGGEMIEGWFKKWKAFPRKRFFFVSTGRNEYGLPYEDVLSKIPGDVYRTDLQGSVTFFSDGMVWSVSVEREGRVSSSDE